jgi:hypothetical protein
VSHGAPVRLAQPDDSLANNVCLPTDRRWEGQDDSTDGFAGPEHPPSAVIPAVEETD